jgi:hypothetical protein
LDLISIYSTRIHPSASAWITAFLEANEAFLAVGPSKNHNIMLFTEQHEFFQEFLHWSPLEAIVNAVAEELRSNPAMKFPAVLSA